MTDQLQRRASHEVPPDRNLALELVRVTEAAALQAARWIGRGDKEAADQALGKLKELGLKPGAVTTRSG